MRPGNFYVVAKGDNPVTDREEAEGFRTDDLLAVNHIDDPRKLQIGQKLHHPDKAESQESRANETHRPI